MNLPILGRIPLEKLFRKRAKMPLVVVYGTGVEKQQERALHALKINLLPVPEVYFRS